MTGNIILAIVILILLLAAAVIVRTCMLQPTSAMTAKAVSYTHLTLPTNREV